MDLQKEREAFEQALVNQKNVSINNLHVCTIFDAEKNKYSPSDVCDPKEDFIVDWINSSWSIWQAAKAQADQKIKLLLCDEHLKKCESPTGVFNSQYPNEEPCLICLAKQAKSQAVPEGFVSVEDKLPIDDQDVIAFDAIKHCVFKGGEFLQGYIESDTGHEYEEPVEVTHWMAVEAQEPAND